MSIDVEQNKLRLANRTGGFSGPALRPIALRIVWEIAGAVSIPVIAIGGVSTTRDALEFLLAGATAVQVGTANFVDPLIWGKLLEGIRSYMGRHNIARISDIVGTVNDHALP
jgi:dihydroorotate dehydrogenase (NAD+) catalytic subunit